MRLHVGRGSQSQSRRRNPCVALDVHVPSSSRLQRKGCTAHASSGASLARHPRQSHTSCAAVNSAVGSYAGVSDFDVLKGISVSSVSEARDVELTSLWQPRASKVVVVFLTHFADLSSWEFVQKLKRVMPVLEGSGVQVIVVGLGSVRNAQGFAAIHKFPASKLFADETGMCYRALGFSRGFRPTEIFGQPLTNVSGYWRLLPMLMGIESPGTLQEVIRGYLGDRNSQPVWDTPTPFDILGTGYQRPFELATLRLFNMVGILPKWGELCPADEDLLTQQGGALAFQGTQTIFRHADRGILDYCDVDALLRAVLSAEVIETSVAPLAQVTSTPSRPVPPAMPTQAPPSPPAPSATTTGTAARRF